MTSPAPRTEPRIALVCDWLSQFGGAEAVLAELSIAFPGAPVFALFDTMNPTERARIPAHPTRTSPLQRIPRIGDRYRKLLPLMPWAIRQLDLRGFDLILSNHHSVAKGVRKWPGQKHLCYCHSPMRYAWERREEYLDDHGYRGAKAALARVVLERIRRWDARTVGGVDRYVANSTFVAQRIMRNYERESVVIHPPVDVDFFRPAPRGERDVYVAASRHVPYKRIDRIVAAFRSTPDRRLIVLGDGPDHGRVSAMAGGASNVELRGEVPRTELRDWFRRAKAFVFAAEEDFGIVPLEAQACGAPVIALGRGGALDTVRVTEGPDRTGLFFDDDTPWAINDAVDRFEALAAPPTAAACRANAERFAPERFRAAFQAEATALLRP